ncbi:XRE family transcriptional regulator [Candidatus Aerophobetes bacterium]|uniref:XRE family transcriptional regulator n=1 Tax=Aerophobetes bacterium TaxID=2030807 RepID=A0A523W4S3_UNCAE|nr:MAG: XRE family transcriptional regulator [Candidatus Aerophobetes bacterium]
MIKVMGERLRKLRKNLGLTQKQFAEKVPGKVDYTYIGKIERGQQYPSLKMLEKIGKAFSVPLGYFCDEEMPSQLLNLLPSDIKDLIQDKEMQELLKLGRRLSKRDTRLMMQIVGILAQGTPLPR